MNEEAGKPHRIRKLEFLINYYSENLSKHKKCSDEWYREVKVIESLKTEYAVLTGRSYNGNNKSTISQ